MTLGKVSPMFSENIDPLAITKRVYWRPVTTGTALKVGDPVCYCKDEQDYRERTTQPASGGTAYAAGSQNYTGALFIVEEPLIDNIAEFAGIVTKLGDKAGADGDLVEIAKGNSGAVVPANVVLTSTTRGRTILAVMVGTRTLGSPTTDCADFENDSDTDVDEELDSKVVGVAMESITAAGLCWVKLDENAFIYQGGNIGQDFLVGSVADDVTVNKMFLNIAVTAGHCQALHCRTVLTGTGGDANRGVYRFETITRGVPADAKHVFGVNCHLEIGAGTVGGGQMSPLKITLRTKNADPDLSNVGKLCAIHIDWILRQTSSGTLTNPPDGNAGHYACLVYINSDSTGSQPNYFLISEHAATVCQGTDDLVKDATCAKTIKVNIASLDYYIPTYTLTELETST